MAYTLRSLVGAERRTGSLGYIRINSVHGENARACWYGVMIYIKGLVQFATASRLQS